MKNILLLLFLLFNSWMGLLAQDSADVRFYVKGSEEFFILLDNKLLPLDNTHKIAVGKHQVSIWSPKYLLFESMLEVSDTNDMPFYAELEMDPEYWAYLTRKENYDKKVFAGRTLPVLIASVGTAASPFFAKSMMNNHEELVKAEFLSQFAVTQDNLEARQKAYSSSTILTATSLGLAVTGWISYFVLKRKVDKISKPVYKQKNPFTDEIYEISWVETSYTNTTA